MLRPATDKSKVGLLLLFSDCPIRRHQDFMSLPVSFVVIRKDTCFMEGV
jgi:hypothetical protein